VARVTIIRQLSPNHSTRGGNRVQILVMHATAGLMPGCLSWLTNPASKVSAHYLVTVAGTVYQLVPETRTAWCAGVSQWRGLEVWATRADGVRVPSVNPVSVNVELEGMNRPDSTYPTAQYVAAVELCRGIVARHGIRRENVVRHLDVSPGRKTDPAGAWPHGEFLVDLFLVPQRPTHRTRTIAWARTLPARRGPHTILDRHTLVRALGEPVEGEAVNGSNLWTPTDRGYILTLSLEAL
jgi:N-acetyl-anhydromuramyl-L-alanine amidase AmpD